MTYFVFCVHNHQPVGNFDSVIEEAYINSYWPFLETLSRHPSIKLSLHNTGYLLDWIAEKHPEYIELLKTMVKAGQVEIVGGGYYEPILSVIPREDRVRQVRMLSDRVEELFGVRPRGIWLAERVWEPTHPSIIREAGLEYLVVDDYHFIKAGLKKEQLGGYYITEDQGNVIKIFPGNEALRYLVPFKPLEQFEEYMRGIANGGFTRGNAAIYGDDGEKFGVWPGTHKWVFHDGWLEGFFRTIERNLEWIRPSTLGEYLDHEEPVGQVYLPNTSYMEMGEWALPADASREYMQLIEEVSKWGEQGQQIRRFLQGGTWRNFFAKYPESNWLHKRMLLVSRELKRRGERHRDAAQAAAERLLFQGQCNDAYWHGVFGGLYLPHLRTKVYESLIIAENTALEDTPMPQVRAFDMDADNHEEIIMRAKDINLILGPSKGGALVELDYRPKGVNLSNTLSRWPEGYHYKLERPVASEGGSGAKSIHDIVKVKEEGLERYLKYDIRRRASFIDHFLGEDATLDSFYSNSYAPQGDFADGRYEKKLTHNGAVLKRTGIALGGEVSIKKEFSVQGANAFTAAYEIKGVSGSEGMFAVELNLILPCCDGPVCQYQGAPSVGEGAAIGLGSKGELLDMESISLVDMLTGVKAAVELDTPAKIWRFPVHTVSLSEAGFEKIFQGSCLVFLYPASVLKGGSRLVFKVTVEGLSS